MKRLDEFLDAYPHEGQTNLDPDQIYTFNDKTLLWSDLRVLVDAQEAYQQACRDQGLPIDTPFHRFIQHHRSNAGLTGYLKGRFQMEDDNSPIDVAIRDLAVEIADVLCTPDFQRDPNSNQWEIDMTESIIRSRTELRARSDVQEETPQ